MESKTKDWRLLHVIGGLGMQCCEKLILSGLGNGSVSNCQYRHKELTSDPQNPFEKPGVVADL